MARRHGHVYLGRFSFKETSSDLDTYAPAACLISELTDSEFAPSLESNDMALSIMPENTKKWWTILGKVSSGNCTLYAPYAATPGSAPCDLRRVLIRSKRTILWS